MSESEGPKVLFPPTTRDLRRAGWSIMAAGFVIALIGYRFFIGTDPTDVNAAWMLWFMSALVVIVSGIMIGTAKARGAPDDAPPQA